MRTAAKLGSSHDHLLSQTKLYRWGLPHFGGYFLVDTSFLFGLKRVENYRIHVSASLNRVSDVLHAFYICRLLVSKGYTGNR
jgi:hypothetical protein